MVKQKIKSNVNYQNELATNCFSQWLIELAALRNALDSKRLKKATPMLINDGVYPYYDCLYPVINLKQIPVNNLKNYHELYNLVANEIVRFALFCLQQNAFPMALSLLFEAIALNKLEVFTWDFGHISFNQKQLSSFQTALALILGIGCTKNIADGVKQLRSIATNDHDYANACFLQGVLIQHELITEDKYSDKHYFKQAKKSGLVQLHYRYPEVKPSCLFFNKDKTEYITEKALTNRRRTCLF